MQKLRRILYSVAIALFAVATALVAVACGSKSYTMKFETNGGTEIPSITAEAGESITVPADPVKENYGFDGWYLSSNFSGEPVQIPNTMPDKNVTYYAKWSDRVTLTFVADGVPPISPITARPGEQITPPNAPNRTGHDFEGWYTNAKFEGDPVESLPTVAPSSNKTYYAKFSRRLTVSYRINLYKTDSTGTGLVEVDYKGDTTKQDCKVGDTVTVKENGFQVEGYKFLGWSVDKNGPILYPSLGKADGQYAPGDEIEITTEYNVVLFAHWMQYFDKAGENYRIGYCDSVETGTEGSAVYIDKATGKETLGVMNVTPTLDWEYTIEVGNTTHIGRVLDSDKKGAIFEFRDPDFDGKVGYYQFYDWALDSDKPSDAYFGAEMYISGYKESSLIGTMLPVDTTAAEQYNAAIAYNNESFLIMISKQSAEDEHYSIFGFNVVYFLGGSSYNVPFIIDTIDINWGDENASEEIEGVPILGSFSMQGDEGAALKSNKEVVQFNRWIYLDTDGSLGYGDYLYNQAIEVDGFGNATIYKVYKKNTEDEEGTVEVLCKGTYKRNGDNYSDAYGEWKFIPAEGDESGVEGFNFMFSDTVQTTDGSYYCCYYKVERNVYKSTANDKVLFETVESVMDSSAVYTNDVGAKYAGSYDLATETVMLFLEEGSSDVRYIKLDREHKTFTELTRKNNEIWMTDGNILIAYFGEEEEVKVPDDIIEIGGYALLGANFKSLDLNNVTKLGNYALMGCEKLTTLKAEKLEVIGANAFYVCSSLEGINLPKIKQIGATAFIGANKLTKVTLGADLTDLGQGAFATQATQGMASSFTVIFADSEQLPKIHDVAGSALLVYGRTNALLQVGSSEKLLAVWEAADAENGWENYVAYLTFEYKEEELAALEPYFGAYFAEDFNAIQLSEKYAAVNGIVALVLWEDGKPAVYVYDDKTGYVKAELEFTLKTVSVKVPAETEGADPTTKEVQRVEKVALETEVNGKVEYIKPSITNAEKQQVTLINEETGEVLTFTLPEYDGQFEIDAKYLPSTAEREEIKNDSKEDEAKTADDTPVDETEKVALVLMYLEIEKPTLAFVRRNGAMYIIKEAGWTHTLGTDGYEGSFVAEYQEEETRAYDFDYLSGTKPREDLLYIVQKTYLAKDLYLRGVFQSLLDKNGKPLYIDDEVMEWVSGESTASFVVAIEFIYDGYTITGEDGTVQTYEGDGYYYSILVNLVLRSFQDGSQQYTFQYSYTRSQVYEQKNVTVGDDEYDVTLYTFVDTDMESESVEIPKEGDLILVMLTKGEGEELIVLSEITRKSQTDTVDVYTLTRTFENEASSTGWSKSEYTLMITWEWQEVETEESAPESQDADPEENEDTETEEKEKVKVFVSVAITVETTECEAPETNA